MRRAFAERGWLKTNFEIKKIVNGIEKESVSRETDHVKAPGGYVGTRLQLQIDFQVC
jgi:type IV secretory pathway protease TraF